MESLRTRRLQELKPSAITRMVDLSRALEGVIHLEQGDPSFKTPDHIVEAAIQALREGRTHYTDTRGSLELRRAVAEKLARENGVDVNRESEVIITSGTQEAMLATA